AFGPAGLSAWPLRDGRVLNISLRQQRQPGNMSRCRVQLLGFEWIRGADRRGHFHSQHTMQGWTDRIGVNQYDLSAELSEVNGQIHGNDTVSDTRTAARDSKNTPNALWEGRTGALAVRKSFA